MFRHIFIGTFKANVSDAAKADFDAFIAHPYHTDHVAKQGAEFLSSYVAAQFEL